MSDGRELVPLRTGFDVVMRGYRRGPVLEYVRAVEEELRLLAADRDANAELTQSLVAEVEQLRVQNTRLARRLDEASRTPVDLDAIPPRMARMVEIAKEEAAEITARAQAAAEHSWAIAQEAAGRLRARYENALAELDRARRETETEHRSLLQQAQVDAAVMTTEADRRRAELDDRAAKRRARVESDFDLAMARRRAEAMREIAEQRLAAKTEAESLVRTATDEAARRRAVGLERAAALVSEAGRQADARSRAAKDEANQRLRDATEEAARLVAAGEEQARARVAAADAEVARLRELRGRLAAQLRDTREVLVGAAPLLAPAAGEDAVLEEPARRTPIPAQRSVG